MGAWIETNKLRLYSKIETSHPIWVRGLKLGGLFGMSGQRSSHPIWVRGLKLKISRICENPNIVAPHMGAWIETSPIAQSAQYRAVAPHMGAWIETNYTIKIVI